VAISLSASLQAQTRPSQPVEAAALALPEAPVPQSSAAPASTATPPTAAEPAPAGTKQQQESEAERELKQEEQQRLLAVVPNFNVVMNGQALPLTGAQKWDLAFHGILDPFYIGWSFVIGGGYSELIDSNSGYGWGPPGYFKRVGASYADNVNGTLIGNALLPQLLHQDPRYFRKGTGSVKSRMWVAAVSTIVCKGDNGKRQFNTSNILGNYISGAISNSYYPADQRGVALTLENGTEVTLFGALGGQFYEFAPDLIRIVFHRHPKAGPAAAPAPPVASPAAPVAPPTAATPR
jgi:hypothetical protein